jgi:predicted nucleotidyltransferase
MTIDQKKAAKSVLIEVWNVLGAFRDEMVLIGGWVPELHYPGRGHVGSLDVDLAISPDAARGNAYDSVRARLVQAFYRLEQAPTRFYRTVPGAGEAVKVDVVTRQYGTGGKSSATLVDELAVNGLRGVDLAFEYSETIEISGPMPDGSQNIVRVRIVRPEAFILIKAFALDERQKPKDAYDIAFVLKYYRPSIQDLARRMKPLLDTGLGSEAWRILQSKFQTLDSVGPQWAAEVAADEAGFDRE